MTMTLDEFADMLDNSARRAEPDFKIDLIKFGEIVATKAKEMIGQEHAGWPPLAPSTIADKEHKGFAVPAPLLRTGEMRDSIIAVVEMLTLAVGSTDKVAAYQELGTSRIPPRPFLSTAMIDSLPVAEGILGSTAVKLLTGKSQ
jgi:hypothetical protein